MSCPFSTSEVYNEVICTARDGTVKCPFADECNQTMMWDSISKYIRMGIQTYELAKKLKTNRFLTEIDESEQSMKQEEQKEKDCNNCANATNDFNNEIDTGCYMCCKGLENNYSPIE